MSIGMENAMRERDEAGVWISTRLLDAGFAELLPRTPEGRHRVLVVSEHDHMAEVVDWMEAGAFPAIICAKVGSRFKLVSFRDDVEEDDLHDVGETCTVGFFFGYLEAKGSPVSFRITPTQLKFELTELEAVAQ